MNRVLLLSSILGVASVGAINTHLKCEPVDGDFYQFSAELLNGTGVVNFDDFRGKVCSDKLYSNIETIIIRL